MNKRVEKLMAAVLAVLVALTVVENVQLVQAEVIVREDFRASSLGGAEDCSKEQEEESTQIQNTKSEEQTQWETQQQESSQTEVQSDQNSETQDQTDTNGESETQKIRSIETEICQEAETNQETQSIEETETNQETETNSELPGEENDKIPAEIEIQITDDGILDYRTYLAGNSPKIHMDLKTQEVNGGAVSNGTDIVSYGITIDDTKIVSLDFIKLMSVSEKLFGDKAMAKIDGDMAGIEPGLIYFTQENDVEFQVNRVGTTVFHVSAFDKIHEIAPAQKEVTVQNSPLHEEDFYIEVDHAGEDAVQKYSYTEWENYLAKHKNWVNGTIDIKLSDEGKRCYTAIKTKQEAVSPSECGEQLSSVTKRYTLWMENPDKNASTRTQEQGTRAFIAGIDQDVPILSALRTDSICYEPTKTETEQYYADNFVLQGSFEDALSGVYKIEYTTKYQPDADTQTWQEAFLSEERTEHADFQIELADGCYPAIAVRAFDFAGNVSRVTAFANDKGEPIQVVVDSSKPRIHLTATAKGQAYSGENDNWTNQDILFALSFEEDSCPYAGLYEYEYVYEKIGDIVNNDSLQKKPDFEQKKTALKPEEKNMLHLKIQEEKNGYYFFQAVSKSGVRCEQTQRQRVLIQHKAPELKPLLIKGVDNAKRKNEWYNKESKVPVIEFVYPDYDAGAISKEYDAPVTIHYMLTVQTDKDKEAQPVAENKAVIGVLSSSDVTDSQRGKKEFVLTKDDLKKHVLDFGYDKATDSAQDGIYTLEYYISDAAGNQSEKETYVYKIDSHAPTDLEIVLSDVPFAAENESSVVYERFYQQEVSGSVSVQYGISGKGSFKILKARRIGEWDSAEAVAFEEEEQIRIAANTRCFLYVQARDYAGNMTECWTRGIVVDSLKPNADGPELVIEPQGANKHGFFKEDVKVKVCVKDAPADDNCAALLSVKASIGKDKDYREFNSVTDSELFSFAKELPTDEELSEASGFETVQIIDAAANESNNAYIEVTATDRAQNAKTSLQQFKIDVTKPEISIEFDNNNAVNHRFYNQPRTAAIQIQEQNFDASLVDLCVTKDGQRIDPKISEWTHDGKLHSAFVSFEEDGDYTIEAGCIDLADNEAKRVSAECFTIDRTAPVVTIELHGVEKNQAGYFSETAAATITVTEHNFDETKFAMTLLPSAKKGSWQHEGDVHTIIVIFDGDNQYHIDCSYTDMAGNAADAQALFKDFVIDTTAPLLSITGVEDGSANAGEVVPVVTVLDRNIDAAAVDISVKTGVGEYIQQQVQKTTIQDENGIGYRFTLTDMNDKPDNIYYLTVSARDMAGNETDLTYRFSLNRTGSAYDLTELMKLMENRYNTYAGLDKIQIVEMNVDTVEEFAVYISRNGTLDYQAAYTRETAGTADIGYTYVYTLLPENFAEEGSYRLSLYSKDRAGNEINNTCDVNGDEIVFIVDNTPPKVVIDGVESGMVYDTQTQEVRIVVTDNFALSEAEFTLINEKNDVIESWDYMELSQEGKTLKIQIAQYKEKLSLLYRIKDMAGNEIQAFRGEQAAPEGFLVTTDKLVQFLNKPAGTAFGRAVLAGIMAFGLFAVWTAIVFVRKRKLA